MVRPANCVSRVTTAAVSFHHKPICHFANTDAGPIGCMQKQSTTLFKLLKANPMQLKSLWFIPSLLIGAFAFSDDHGNLGSGVLKQTTAGSFYSSQETMDEGFPFSDVVVVSGELVFLSGLVRTDVEGELVDGGLVPESHAIFRQMQNHLDQIGLDLDDVVKCLVMIDNIDEWADFNNIYTSYFKPPYPARSAFGADGLALGAALELECTAVKR